MTVIEEWTTEPDDETWKEEITGYTCRIIRHNSVKHLCGYVYVPKSHPWFKRGYDEDDRGSKDFNIYGDRPEGMIDVHGGITWSGKHEDDNDDAWCFGFDCAHAGDLSLGNVKFGFDGDTYRNWAYVVKQCEQMAEQLANYEPKKLIEEMK